MTQGDRHGTKTAHGYAAAEEASASRPATATVGQAPAAPPAAPPVRPSTNTRQSATTIPPAPPPAGAGSLPRKYTPVNAAQTDVGSMAALTRGPLVEVDVSYEQGVSPTAEPLRIAVEVWTQNNVYALDARMRCVSVRSQQSGLEVADHPFVGTRLVGGQLKGDGSIEMSYPLPRPGSFAVFEGRRGKKRRFSRTSVVEKVVLRLRVVTVSGQDATPTWEHLADH